MDIVETTALIAPEVDRLVFAIGHAISSTDRARIRDAADEAGLKDLGPLPEFGEFLRGRGVTIEVLERRKPYARDGEVRAWISSLDETSLISEVDGRWHASERLAPLLAVLDEAVDNASISLWSDDTATVEECNRTMAAIIDGVSSDHIVTAAHRVLELPDDECAAMFRRLRTMRYIRQHDHVEAWRAADLVASEMSVLTELWHGGVVDESDALTSLVDRGLANTDLTLTAEGQELRDRIEDETNRRNAESFSVLGEAGSQQLLDNLRNVPPT